VITEEQKHAIYDAVRPILDKRRIYNGKSLFLLINFKVAYIKYWYYHNLFLVLFAIAMRTHLIY